MKLFYKLYFKIRFGVITHKITERIDGIPCEYEYFDSKGRLIGHWAYGAFNPNYPYRGQDIKGN